MTRKKIYYCNKYTKEKYFVKFVEKIINQCFTSQPLFKNTCEEVYETIYDYYDKNYNDVQNNSRLNHNPLDESVNEIAEAGRGRLCGPGHSILNSATFMDLIYKSLKSKRIYYNDRIRNIIYEYLKTQANQFYLSNGYAIKSKLLKSKYKRKEIAKDFV